MHALYSYDGTRDAITSMDSESRSLSDQDLRQIQNILSTHPAGVSEQDLQRQLLLQFGKMIDPLDYNSNSLKKLLLMHKNEIYVDDNWNLYDRAQESVDYFIKQEKDS